MPPRKSTSSIPPTENEAGSPTTSTAAAAVAGAQVTEQQLKAQSEGISVEDLLLPRSVTQRLAKSVLPPNTTIQKDALLAIQKAATVFVSYLSSHANEATLKRTLAPADILAALSELEFDSLRPRLVRELDAHTEAQADKKRAKEKKAAASLNDTQDRAEVTAAGSLNADDSEKNKEKMTTAIKGHKRMKRDSDGNEKSGISADETELEEPDDDETEEEVEDDEDEDNDEAEDDEEEGQGPAFPWLHSSRPLHSAEDMDRVEDLDAPMQRQDDESGSDEDDDGPAAQLRSNMGLG